MKNTLLLSFCYLVFQVVGAVTGGLKAQTAVTDSLCWTWEVTTTTSTKTKTCTLAFVDSLQMDWGDGTVEWIGDSLSTEIITHVYTSTGNFVCTASGTELSYFKADSRRLLVFDARKAPDLAYLSCTSSQLKTLDLSCNPKLESLYCGSNDLTELDLSANTLLQTLTCSDNLLVELDVSVLPLLKKVTCHTNPLISLHVQPTGALNNLSCSGCNLSAEALDSLFEQLPVLETVSTSQNLSILNNPGTYACHTEIAIAKNWTMEKVVTKSTFYLPATSSRIGDTAVMTICLNNVSPAIAFELDVLLPEGFELDTLRSCLTDARKSSHVLSIAKTSDSTQLYKFLAYSMTSKDVFLGIDGAVLQLFMTVPDTVRMYTINLKKAVLVDTSSNIMDVTLTDGKLTVIPVYYIGDSDGNQQIDVTDIVWLVAWINGRNPVGFQQSAADIDGNGVWNVVDIVKMVDIINSGTPPSQSSAKRSEADDFCQYDAMANRLSNHVYLRQSETDGTMIDVCLDNYDDVQAFQVDIVLSPGIKLGIASAMLLPDRSDGHILSLKCISEAENRYRLVAWSLRSDNALRGSSGAVVRLSIQNTTSESDTLSGRLESSVLTGMDMKTVSSHTYDTRLSFPNATDAMDVKAGSDGKGALWVKGKGLKEVLIFDLTGKIVAALSKPENGFFRTKVNAGVYLVKAIQENLPTSMLKVFVP